MDTPLQMTPNEMQAIVQDGVGGPEVLSLRTVPVPEPGPDQVLVRVYAAAVNPIDWKMRGGYGPPPPAGGPVHRIVGMDVAGVVEKLGPGVTGFEVGDPVFSMIGFGMPGLNGSYAEFTAAPVDRVVAKPENLTYAEAVGLCTTGVTANRTNHLAGVTEGDRVFITGAAGGVGSLAVQIAKARGAYVVGTASARHHEFLNSIGIDEIVDYTRVRFEEKIQDMDVVIDTVGGESAERAVGTVRRGGRFVTIVRGSGEAQCEAAGVNFTSAGPGSGGPSDRDLLRETARLAVDGKLRVHIDRTYPLARAVDAQNHNQAGHTQGKVVLIVDADKANRR